MPWKVNTCNYNNKSNIGFPVNEKCMQSVKLKKIYMFLNSNLIFIALTV